MRWIDDYQLYLFDLDGLLVDTEPLHYTAYVKASVKWDIPWPYTFEQYCKVAHAEQNGIKKAFLRDFPNLLEATWNVLATEKKKLYMECLESSTVALMPGVERFLSSLFDLKKTVCVVTNSPLDQAEKIKKSINILQSIPHWITRDDCHNPKPSPEGYLTAIARYAPQKESRIIGFEDTFKGFKALSQTSARPVLICPSYRDHVSECLQLGGLHFTSFDALADI